MSQLVRLSEEDGLVVRRRMSLLQIATRDAFGQVEPLHLSKFQSGVYRQFTSFGGIFKYSTIEEIAANVFFGIAMSHAFENGNKRTALLSMLAIIEKNKYYLTNTTEDDLYELARSVAAHEVPVLGERTSDSEVQAIASWLRKRLRAKKIGDNAMPFKELKRQLELFDCSFDNPYKNYIKINRNGCSVRTGYPKHNFIIDVGEIKRIRRALHLDEQEGIDSGHFYNLESTVDKFVNEYRDLMRRLADL